MDPVLSATYTAAQLGVAQISDGVALIVSNGSADLILCEAATNRPRTIDLGAVSDPGTGYYVPQSPPMTDDWSMVQASDGMALQVDGTQQRLFLFGASSALSMSVINASGTPGTAQLVSTSIGSLTKVQTFTVVPDSFGDLTALSRKDIAGFQIFAIGANGFLTLTATIPDTGKSYVKDVADSASVLLDGQAYLLTISAGEAGMTCYTVTPQGQAELNDSLGNIDGLAIAGAAALQTAQVGGQTFAIIASVTSSSLSVVRVNDMGCLFETDHVVDDHSSRIKGASALDVFEVGGRVFVVAGGADAGLTIYEVLPGGTLGLVSSAAFETGQGMGNIASIDAAVNGDVVSIFVTEESATRVQVFQSDFSQLGSLIVATGNQTSGSGMDDRLMGRSSADTLSGGGGDDFLHDGAGADRLVGGAGADVFVLCADTSTDTIADFENGTDRIDLSDWGRIYAASDLTVAQTATGAQISFGGHVLVVNSSNGAPLSVGAFTDADFIF